MQTQNMELEFGAMGKRKAKSTARLEVAQKVAAPEPEGPMFLDMTYERMVMDMEQERMSQHWDSAEPRDDAKDGPLGLLRDIFIGLTVSIKVSRQGEVLEVRGIEEFLQALDASIKDDPALRQSVTMMQASFKPELVKAMCQQGLIMFKAGPVKVGDSWTRESTVANPLLGPMKIISTYTVEEEETKAETDCVRLGVDMKLEYGGESPLIENIVQGFGRSGAEVNLETRPGQMDGEGTVWVAKDTGLVVFFEATQRMNLDFVLTTSQAGQQAPPPGKLVLTQDLAVERLQ